MRRRQFLSATTGLSVLPGVAGGTPVSTPSTRQASQDEFEPLGWTAVAGIKETVVDEAGETAYAATTDGFATVDVSDPTDPTVLAERRDLLADRDGGPMRLVFDAKLDGDHLVVVGPANPREDTINAAVFYDVSDPATPRQVGVFETDFPIHNCDFVDGIAYLTGNSRQGNDLVLVALCERPREVGRWSIADHDEAWNDVFPNLWTLHDVLVHRDRAYLAHWDAGTWIVDVSDPTAPSFVARVRGRDPSTFADIGRTELVFELQQPPGNDHYVAVDEDASLLGLGVESWDVAADESRGGPGGIELYDISEPTAPERLAGIDPRPSPDPRYGGVWTTAHNFEFVGDRLYAAWYQGGVTVHDVSDPSSPTRLAAWRDAETTSFWTARDIGGAFVAPSGLDKQLEGTLPDRLYTFPDPGRDRTSVGGSQASTRPLRSDGTTVRDEPAVCNRLGGESVTEQADGTTTGTDDRTDGGEETGGIASGFGVLAALAGAGLGVEALRRRRR
jgi:hypothetical protein